MRSCVLVLSRVDFKSCTFIRVSFAARIVARDFSISDIDWIVLLAAE